MDLGGILKRDKKKPDYWAIILEPGSVQAGIWSVAEGKVGMRFYSPTVFWETEEELINSADTALSSCMQEYPEGEKEPSEVVFGLVGDWVSEGNIKPDYLTQIKKICTELSLEPAGFVVLSEAIAHLIKIEEGSPTTSVIIGVYPEEAEISLYEMGKLMGSSLVARSVSVADDLVEGLTRLGKDKTFPSRLVLYNGKEGELEELKQALIEADWDSREEIKFFHPPKVEVVSIEKKILATALAGGLELENIGKVVPSSGAKASKEEKSGPQEIEGFVMGADISSQEKPVSGPRPSPEKTEESDWENQEVQAQAQKVGETPTKESVFSKMGGILTKLKGRLPKFGKAPGVKEGKKLLIVGGAVFVLLLMGGFAGWWFVPKAVVTIYVSPQKLEERDRLVVDSGASSLDLEGKILPGKAVGEKVTADKTRTTSGRKTVGERAKGEVTIYRSGKEIALPEGTILESGGGLEFTVDADVTVASGSASSPGTAKVQVTAANIGTEHNLASDESFSVANYPKSEVEAKSESAFTGGSSREISVVSEEDQEKLVDDLTQEIIQKGLEKIRQELEPTDYVIPEAVETEVEDESYDNRVGDEAASVKLTLTLKVTTVVINQADLVQSARKTLEDKVSGGYVLRDDQVKVEFNFLGREGGAYEMEANFVANLLPKIETEEIRKEIAGKYPKIASNYLKDVRGYERVEVNIRPKFPGRLGTLPRVAKNITIEVESF